MVLLVVTLQTSNTFQESEPQKALVLWRVTQKQTRGGAKAVLCCVTVKNFPQVIFLPLFLPPGLLGCLSSLTQLL